MHFRLWGLLLLVLALTIAVTGVGAQDEHDHDHEHDHEEAPVITDLTPWAGEWLSIWALSEAEMQPAIEAILASTPELTADDVLTYLEDGNFTAFDTFAVDGQRVIYQSEDGEVSCGYVYTASTPVVEFPTATWTLFATSDQGCDAYRYLLLMPSHASEEGSVPHFHMRYGSETFAEAVADSSPWYPSLYPAETATDAILNSWVVNGRMIALFIADSYGIDVALTDEELAQQAE